MILTMYQRRSGLRDHGPGPMQCFENGSGGAGQTQAPTHQRCPAGAEAIVCADYLSQCTNSRATSQLSARALVTYLLNAHDSCNYMAANTRQIITQACAQLLLTRVAGVTHAH